MTIKKHVIIICEIYLKFVTVNFNKINNLVLKILLAYYKTNGYTFLLSKYVIKMGAKLALSLLLFPNPFNL